MKLQHPVALVVLVMLSSCGPKRETQPPVNNSESPVLPAPSAPPGVSNNMAAAEPKPQPQPQRTIDPKSTEAALEVVHGFVDLLNRRKFDEAYMLLGPNAPPRADFDRRFSSLSDLTVTIGQAGGQEGAAGSIYLSMPLTISGVSKGQRVSRSATAILRRVNDVPGSTEAQRRWHIERIDWEDAADAG